MELFGNDAEMAETVSKFRQQYYMEEDDHDDDEQSEEDKEEVKMPKQEHRKVLNLEEEKKVEKFPWRGMNEVGMPYQQNFGPVFN